MNFFHMLIVQFNLTFVNGLRKIKAGLICQIRGKNFPEPSEGINTKAAAKDSRRCCVDLFRAGIIFTIWKETRP